MDPLVTDDAECAAKEIEGAAEDVIKELDRVLPRALRGGEAAAKAYVRAWRDLAGRCLKLAHESMPDLVFPGEDGAFLLVDVKGRISVTANAHLEYLAVNAPFSPWLNRFGVGHGAAMFLLSEIRQALPGLHAIPLSDEESGLPNWDFDRTDFSSFVRHVWAELQEEEGLLERIDRTFQLTATEMGRLFGVRRQAIDQWLEHGVPPARQPKALVIAQIADVLALNLEPSRIPAIVRTSASAYGGHTMLEMIADERHEELLAMVRDSFDWATTA